MIPLVEAQRRDRVLRAYIDGRDWDLDREHELRRHLVLRSGVLLPAWPLLIGVEWPAPDGSPGDLLFFDGVIALAAIEIKYLGTKRNPRRNDVEKQATKHGKDAQELWPGATVAALVYTCDEHDAGLPPRAPDARVRSS